MTSLTKGRRASANTPKTEQARTKNAVEVLSAIHWSLRCGIKIFGLHAVDGAFI